MFVASHKFAMVFDRNVGPELLPVFRNRANAMRADGNQLFYAASAQSLHIRFRKLSEYQVVAETPRRIARAFLALQHTKRSAEMPHHVGESANDFAAARIVGAHAAHPQAIFLRSVE